jgi:uncharacterized SAM-binding protein YcdF (DUF218 family)
MLQSVVELVKSSLVPGSRSFLLAGATIAVALAWGPRRLRPLAIPALALLVCAYWIASLPIVSDALATHFNASGARPVIASAIAGAKAIVVLGAGVETVSVNGRAVTLATRQSAYNALEAVRVAQLLPYPVPIIASGGRGSSASKQPESELLRDMMVRYGVPADVIELESASSTTHEQAMFASAILRARHFERFVLVAPPAQLPRAAAAFRAQGVEPIPAPADYPHEDSPGRSKWLPSVDALNASENASYDYLAALYYWLRGWLAPRSSSATHVVIDGADFGG